MQDFKAAYQDFLNTEFWQTISSECKERDGNRCRICNSSYSIAAHHRRYPNPWTATTLDDLTTLCHACHELYHKKSYGKPERAVRQSKQPKAGQIVLTRELIQAATNCFFALNSAQMRLLGLNRQPKLKRLIGKKITLANYEKLKSLNRIK